MNILDNIYGTLFKPNLTFAELFNREVLPGAFLIICLVAVFNGFQNALIFNVSNGTVAISVLLSIFLYFFIWIFSSLFLTFTADFLGGAGKISDTMIGLAYAMLPLIFISPLYVMTNTMGEYGESLYFILKLVIYIWTIALIILSLKYAHKFHTTQAILSIVSIFALIIIFSVGAMMISVLGIILSVSLLA
jgi:hypothetical protein